VSDSFIEAKLINGIVQGDRVNPADNTTYDTWNHIRDRSGRRTYGMPIKVSEPRNTENSSISPMTLRSSLLCCYPS
jgi:hypothetical protein